MFRFRVERFLIVGLLIFAWLIIGAAQRPCLKVDEGKVVGHLRDVKCKSDIAKAAIRIKGEKIQQESKSDSRGNFVFCVPPGLYEVTVEKYGYKRYVVTNISVTAETVANVDIEMEHGWSSDDPNAGRLKPCPRASEQALRADSPSADVFVK